MRGRESPHARTAAEAGPPVALELVSVHTVDGLELDGARYRPQAGNTREGRGFMLVHGMRWNFYRGPSRWLARMLAERGYDCLALNLRDHDSLEPQGLDAAFHDLRAGIDALAIDCAEVILLAHGYGCTKVMSYAAQSLDCRARRHVLTTLGAVQRSHPPIWQNSLVNARAMQGRTLIVQGAIDHLIEAKARADELAAAADGTAVEFVLLGGANHYFDQRHGELIDCVTTWEARTRD